MASAREKLELLVTVKAYPAISLKYGEVVCVAGIRTDTPSPAWVRLYPIPFRDLEFARQFKKYQIITLEAERPATDKRPETLRPNTDSLVVGKIVKTDRRWAKRRALVDPLVVESMCWLLRQQAISGTSLGVLRPAAVEDLEITPEAPEWDPAQAAVANQPSLMRPAKAALERIPYRFRYVYRCSDAACPGHRQTIIDWEIHQAYRDWRHSYGPEGVLDAIKHKWLNEVCGSSRDTHFFVGNMHRHPEQFLVLGVFWPPRA